ncbi:hypothetical protein GH714_027739 [Hevea brasiliensis]|uniref:Ubiquitin-like protease family profile domain-containing protein n=1 Tax=Hevea brasiliensis TaxID=3981 RepID=A0A6A6KVS8_HEVBR|nr:hypothetical protein GH714_027739 [Hevea brasiliensis]
MEEENSKKRPLDLDWDVILDSKDDEQQQILIVKGPTQLPKPSPMSTDHSPREDCASMTDRELEDGIKRQKLNIANLSPILPDKGEKLRALLKTLEDEYQRRKLRRPEMDIDVFEKPAQLTSSGITDCKIVKAFDDEELSTLSRCNSQKTRTDGALSQSWRKKVVDRSMMALFKQGKTVVLVDEDETQLVETIEPENKHAECMKDAKIYYPSSLHWSLVIICIPDKEDDLGPIILHLDSLGLHSSKSVFEDIRSYLREEWNYMKQEVSPPDLPIADRIWKHLPRRIDVKKIEVPQQKNDYDCGLFVLFFMERFIEEAPERLKKKDLAMFGKRWFRPEQASGLRVKIRKLLSDEFQKAYEGGQYLEFSPSSSGASP